MLSRIRFDRHELAGAFGDIGTDLPLIVALVGTCGLDAASVCIVFGLGQVLTGLLYGIPMPVQPLKAMATIMLAQKLSAGTLAGGGLVIGVAMLLLALSGLLDLLARIVPGEVVRGMQLGLGVTLATLALQQYAGADGVAGYALAAVAFLMLVSLRHIRRFPAPILVIGLGVAYALAFKVDGSDLARGVGVRLPSVVVPTWKEVADGALLLALPQIPLSLGNSVIATSRTSADLFPQVPVTVKRIGTSYGLMNLLGPWLGGLPVCHGCGGMVGFHAFGARTGGAPVIYGMLYLVLGLFFAPGFAEVVAVFPMPLLGVVLLVEAIALMMLARDAVQARPTAWVAFAVAVAVVALPYGYVVGLVVGSLLAWGLRRGWVPAP
ncbi:MAG: putative sulfate/molybdate transporter [Deltaproteobacteria bacterium]|nr:putative sulfate/molybdate transporter [Deltaproteobacteria bacterium]